MLTRSRALRSLATPAPVRVGNLGLGGPLDPSVNVIEAGPDRRRAVIDTVLAALRHDSSVVEVLVDGKRAGADALVPELTIEQLVLDKDRLLALAAGPDGALALVERWMNTTSRRTETQARLEDIRAELAELDSQEASAVAVASEAFDVLAQLELAAGGREGLERALAAIPASKEPTSAAAALEVLTSRRDALAAERRERNLLATATRIRHRLVTSALAAWHRAVAADPGPDSYATALADTLEAAEERRARLAALRRPTETEVALAAELVSACKARVADFEAPTRATTLDALHSGVRRGAAERGATEQDLAEARRAYADLLALQADAESLVALEAEIVDLQHLADRLLRCSTAPHTIDRLRSRPAVADEIADSLAAALWSAGADLRGDDLASIAEEWLETMGPAVDVATDLLDAAIAAADNEIAAAIDAGAASPVAGSTSRLDRVRRARYQAALCDDADASPTGADPTGEKWSTCEALVARAAAAVDLLADRRTALTNVRRQAIAADCRAADAEADARIALLESAPQLLSRTGGIDGGALDRHIRQIKASTPATFADWLAARTDSHGLSLPIILDRALDDLPRADAIALVQDLAMSAPLTQFIVLVDAEDTP